jgi:hypothetical protein
LKLKPKKKKQKTDNVPSWSRAVLPSTEIPDISEELGVLVKDTGSIMLADKEDSVIVPTRFLGYNRANRTGGSPTSCISLIHGPSQGGKTAFLLGLCSSFQAQGHFAFFADAEHTVEKKLPIYCRVDPNQLPYLAPRTYEQTTKAIEKLISNFEKGRDKGVIDKNRCLLIGVDSITKLVPEEELKELSKVGKGYPLRAMMNTAWLDKLTPVVGSLPIHFAVLAHEKVKLDAAPFEKKYTIKGGRTLVYDSTVAIRIQNEKSHRITVGGKRVEVARIHKGVIEKNKMGICHEMFRFVMGMGKHGYPIGIDPIGEIVEEAKLRGENSPIVRKTNGKWVYGTDHLCTGDEKFKSYLRERPEFVDRLYAEFNATAIDLDVQEESPNEED